MSEQTELQAAWSALLTGMNKQWGVLPSEISKEAAAVDILINPPAPAVNADTVEPVA